MKVSYNWLQTFFDAPLPPPAELVDTLTFHSSEIEETMEKGGDTVLDVKVLPDKSAWMLSHRGVAREIATILGMPMQDPFATPPVLQPNTDALTVTLDTDGCTRYMAAVVTGVTVGPSPAWLTERLTAIGQRSINNVVDATNYVMFHLGQPLHAFDAGKLGRENDTYALGVRAATEGESITTLTGETYTLSPLDMVIVDRTNNTPIGIAGVKGGKHAEVDAGTTDLVIESANFDRVMVRKTAQRLKLRTDASARYENGVVPETAAYGIEMVARLIAEIAGGTVQGFSDMYPTARMVSPVSVSIPKINSVLGLALSADAVEETLARFGYERTWTGDVVTVTPPFERDDLTIPEDLIEEIGRMYGLEHIPTIIPSPMPLAEYNTEFFYAEEVRRALVACGFSEIFTSSFRKKDAVKLKNALASDKGYLRSTLRDNMDDALVRNALNKDLLGLPYVALFEIGTVFTPGSEHCSLALGVRTGAAYSPKKDDPLLNEAIAALANVLGPEHFVVKEGIAEVNFTQAIADLPDTTTYAPFTKGKEATYAPFSSYPFVARDIALWVTEGTSADEVLSVLKNTAEPLCVRTTLFDEFRKDGKVSYAFRLVFQSYEKTLTDSEVNDVIENVVHAVSERGWDVR